MQLVKLGPNMTEVRFSDGLRVLYSYETPVAAILANGEVVKTARFVSRTASQQTRNWLGEKPARAVPHDEIVRLVDAR